MIKYVCCCGVAQLAGTLRYEPEVAGSIPDGVTGTFYCHNPSGRIMTLEMSHSITETSTRNINNMLR
jgi:hypothetical protein